MLLSLTRTDLVFLGRVAGRIRTERTSELHSTVRGTGALERK